MRIREIKEHDYDDIMEREKKLKMAWRIKDLLVKQPQWSMTLLELGKNRDDIGFPRKKQFLSFLKRLPAIFQVKEDGDEDDARMLLLSTHFHLTPEAEALCKEECRIQEQMKPELVDKLRKLLMMSSSRQLALGKVAHLAQALGLPADFRKALVHQYPQYFRVVDSAEVSPEEGPVLELVQWNNELAITAAEKKLQEMMSQSSSGTHLSFIVLQLFKGILHSSSALQSHFTFFSSSSFFMFFLLVSMFFFRQILIHLSTFTVGS
jgi:hypothetical protein